jgi:DNA (cytosine-5)-methyltransferase 1
MTPSFRFIDLFAGVGGFHHGLSAIGGKCVMACEMDEECRNVYQCTFPGLPSDRFPRDIRSLTQGTDGSPLTVAQIARTVPDHEVLCAGFPCQPFSKSGTQLGVRDRTRGTLFFDIMEIVRAKAPRYLILENVRNLAGPRHRDTWATIIQSIREAGYRVSDEPLILSPHLIPAERGGAPQVRDRVFILCDRVASDDPVSTFGAPLLNRHEFRGEWHPDRWSIADYLDADREIGEVQRYRLSQTSLTWIEAWEYFVQHLPSDDLPGFPVWADCLVPNPVIPAGAPAWKASHLRNNASLYIRHRNFIDDWLDRPWGPDGHRILQFPQSRLKLEWQARKAHPTRAGRTLSNLVLQFRPSGIRVKPATYLPALVAITQTSIVGPRVAPGINSFRKLTPREAARLQGLPFHGFEDADTSDRAIYKQLGNAVNVGVVRLATETLLGIRRPHTRQTTSPMAPSIST